MHRDFPVHGIESFFTNPNPTYQPMHYTLMIPSMGITVGDIPTAIQAIHLLDARTRHLSSLPPFLIRQTFS